MPGPRAGKFGLLRLLRRPWAIAVLLVISLAVSSVVIWGGREMPVRQWEEAGQLWARLLEVQADRLLPEEYADAESRHALLREQFYRLSAESALLRNTEEFEAALLRHSQGVASLVDGAERRRRDLLEQQAMELAALAQLLEPGPARILIPEYRKQRAHFQMKLEQARRLQSERQVFRVAELLDELKDSSATVKAYLEELEARFADPELLGHWERLCERARRLSVAGGRVLLVDKYHRRTHVLEKGRRIRTFQVELGWNGLRDKIQQGDGATPEGEYKVTRKKAGGDTIYYKALLIDYPNQADRVNFQQAVRAGRVSRRARIGGLIEIHGDGGRGQDWTDGCVALENSEMDKLYSVAYVGMPVIVVGKCPNGIQ